MGEIETLKERREGRVWDQLGGRQHEENAKKDRAGEMRIVEALDR